MSGRSLRGRVLLDFIFENLFVKKSFFLGKVLVLVRIGGFLSEKQIAATYLLPMTKEEYSKVLVFSGDCINIIAIS